jgi:integrase
MSKRFPGVFRVRFRNRRGQKQWSRTWFITYRARRGGPRIREATGLKSKEAAWQVRVRRLSEIQQGRFVGPAADKVTLKDLAQLVKGNLGARGKKTAARVGLWLDPVVEHFGDAPAMRLTIADFDDYALRCKKAGVAAGTVAVRLAWVRRGYRLAVKARLLPPTAMPDFPQIAVDNARQVFADWPVVERLIAFLPNHLRPILLTAHFSGWRMEAILSRRRSDLDLEGRWLYLERASSKGGQPVRIWLNDMLLSVFRAQDELAREIERQAGRTIPWLFFYPETTRNYRAGDRIAVIKRGWEKARKAAGIPHVRFHDVKRGAIRTLRRAGLAEHEIMEWVGLKTREVFDRYDIIDEDRLREMGQRQQAHHEREAAERKVETFKQS